MRRGYFRLLSSMPGTSHVVQQLVSGVIHLLTTQNDSMPDSVIQLVLPMVAFSVRWRLSCTRARTSALVKRSAAIGVLVRSLKSETLKSGTCRICST